MIIVIPLGGLGLRFKKLNYKLPKPLINVMGKPILYWLLDNLNFESINFVIIPYNSELSDYLFEEKLLKDYPKINFLFYKLTQNTRGAAETIYLSLCKFKLKDQPVLCLDGDNFYTDDIISKWNGKNCVFTFEDNSTDEIYSYVKTNNDNKIITIVEKKKISNNASTGAYGFNSIDTLKLFCKFVIDNDIRQKNEYYISTVIKEMILQNKIFEMQNIKLEDYICLGTPLHVRLFCNNYPKISAINSSLLLESKNYSFELFNTLVKDEDNIIVPIDKNVNFLEYLKKLGHYIIIKSDKDNAKTILDNLHIPYDEIDVSTKADFIIGTNVINSKNDLEKEFGYYINSIKPRKFNSITVTSIQTVKKESENLSGEIYYYKNIPNEIKDMFPFMINYDINNKWYDMEKINGVPISKLYLSEQLTKEQLNHIIGSIIRIQNCFSNEKINIYSNYIPKLNERYQLFDYSIFENYDNIYNDIKNKLLTYKKESRGRMTVIHGDTVMTNILINEFGKIKFIDMRGEIDNKLSICGDWLYDWAKLYQSLIGYDEILEGVTLNKTYKKEMIDYFEKQFLERLKQKNLDDLKLITKSLIFTLIPLHNESRHKKFFDLINILV